MHGGAERAAPGPVVAAAFHGGSVLSVVRGAGGCVTVEEFIMEWVFYYFCLQSYKFQPVFAFILL